MTPEDKKLLHYFIQRTDERLAQIDAKLDKLNNFRFKVIGMASLGVALVEFLFKVVYR